jgi:6,7-dimethyl-8-ribityllumazine synthase
MDERIKTLEGDFNARGLRFGIVASRFNDFIVDRLLDAAIGTLSKHGVATGDIEVVRVPGAFELPGACARVLDRGGVDGVVALGCVIRGETQHFEFVAGEATRGLGELSRISDIPVSFGVLTTDTLEQALVRAGNGSENKGWEAAITALEMANLYRSLR